MLAWEPSLPAWSLECSDSACIKQTKELFNIDHELYNIYQIMRSIFTGNKAKIKNIIPLYIGWTNWG
ncbi:hypothetical protein GCM10007981_00120 [Thermocladium modestius]|uniref:Uncharacterized protein n=1 Tax=Thermocladium modestius TaxID=62609 RepID=A0A830GQK3_9CREN|nr:hypothetical protein GCM10007981_00120 [Thermocladium modestius]